MYNSVKIFCLTVQNTNACLTVERIKKYLEFI